MSTNKIESEKIKDLPQGKAGKDKPTDKKFASELTPDELDKAAGGVIVTHIPGNPV
jgi:hypothetical protein